VGKKRVGNEATYAGRRQSGLLSPTRFLPILKEHFLLFTASSEYLAEEYVALSELVNGRASKLDL
jgi:hypothetical protein